MRVMRVFKERFPDQIKQIEDLVEVFNAYALWSWVEGEVKKVEEDNSARQKKETPNTAEDADKNNANSLAAPSLEPGGKLPSTPGLKLFAELAVKMQKWLSPETNKFIYLSTTGDAILWRQLVGQYPNLVSYLFNEKDDDAIHWALFYEKFYRNYWRLHRRSLRQRIEEYCLNSDEGGAQAQKEKEQKEKVYDVLKIQGMKMANLMSKVSKVPPHEAPDQDEKTKRERKDAEGGSSLGMSESLSSSEFRDTSSIVGRRHELGRSRLFVDRELDSQSAQVSSGNKSIIAIDPPHMDSTEATEGSSPKKSGTDEQEEKKFWGLAWLLRVRDRAVMAHWLAVTPDNDSSRIAFVALVCSIGGGKHLSLVEKVMNVLTLGSVSY